MVEKINRIKFCAKAFLKKLFLLITGYRFALTPVHSTSLSMGELALLKL